jgi:hypothetical protein
MVVEKKGTRLTLLIAGAVFSAVVITAVLANSEFNNGSAPTGCAISPNIPHRAT